MLMMMMVIMLVVMMMVVYFDSNRPNHKARGLFRGRVFGDGPSRGSNCRPRGPPTGKFLEPDPKVGVIYCGGVQHPSRDRANVLEGNIGFGKLPGPDYLDSARLGEKAADHGREPFAMEERIDSLANTKRRAPHTWHRACARVVLNAGRSDDNVTHRQHTETGVMPPPHDYNARVGPLLHHHSRAPAAISTGMDNPAHRWGGTCGSRGGTRGGLSLKGPGDPFTMAIRKVHRAPPRATAHPTERGRGQMHTGLPELMVHTVTRIEKDAAFSKQDVDFLGSFP